MTSNGVKNLITLIPVKLIAKISLVIDVILNKLKCANTSDAQTSVRTGFLGAK